MNIVDIGKTALPSAGLVPRATKQFNKADIIIIIILKSCFKCLVPIIKT